MLRFLTRQQTLTAHKPSHPCYSRHKLASPYVRQPIRSTGCCRHVIALASVTPESYSTKLSLLEADGDWVGALELMSEIKAIGSCKLPPSTLEMVVRTYAKGAISELRPSVPAKHSVCVAACHPPVLAFLSACLFATL